MLYLGLHVTAGAGLLVASAWMFGVIAEDVATGDLLTVIDVAVAHWVHANATPRVTRAMWLITGLASVWTVVSVSLAVALLLCARKDWRLLSLLGLTVPGGMLLNVLLKVAFERARPNVGQAPLLFSGYSFPSGHTMAATLLYGSVGIIVAQHIRSWRWRVTVAMAVAGLAVLVAFSRVYLGAHYLSDVLGAIAAGTAWIAVCSTGLDLVRQRRRRR